MKIQNLMKLFAPAALLAFSAMSANAGLINGSLALAGIGAANVPGGSDLSTATSVTTTSNLSTSSPFGIGDYIPIPVGTTFSTTALTFSSLATGGGYSFSNASFGTFVATSGVLLIPRTATNADVFLLGLFTPGAGLAGAGLCGGTACVATSTLAHLSINQTNGSVSEAITLASPSSSLPSVPEPATLTLFGSALVGLGIIGRKRLSSR